MSFNYNGHWDSVHRLRQTFDAHNNIITQKDANPVYAWVGGDYFDSIGYYYSSSANKYIECSRLRKKWNTIFNNWEPYELYSCTLDTSNLPQYMLKQIWNRATLMWDNAEHENYTRDSHHDLITTELFTYNTAKRQWEPFRRTSISYFAPALYSRVVIANYKNNVWVDSVSTVYSYNSKNEVETETATQWNITAATWSNGKRYNRTYDASHNVITQITQHWVSNVTGWSNARREIFTYDGSNNLLTAISDTWNVSGGTWVYDVSSVLKRNYYGPFVPSDIPQINAVQDWFSIYPNPCNGIFTLMLTPHDWKSGTVSVYNMLGECVFKSQLIHPGYQITLNQPKGIYTVNIELDGAVSSRRLELQ